jgi:curli biogenesis system outer membrane secretion channel CsgG
VNRINKRKIGIVGAVACVALLASGCVSNETKLGGGSTEVTGSGGAAGTQGESSQLFKCARPIGTAALLEPEYNTWTQLGLSSPVPLVKLMMAQSGCFKVVSRGATSRALERERALSSSGELQTGSRMGGGQMVAADYIIEPSIVHKDADAGGSFGGLGGLLPGAAGVLAGGISVSNLEAQTLLALTDVRTGVQEAIAEGSASKSDIGFGGLGWVGAVGGVGGSYEDTDIGKIVAAAFMDAHNKLVTQLGAIPAGQGSAADNAGYKVVRGVNFRTGPTTQAPIIQTLTVGTPVYPTGQKQGAWWEVEANGRTGWVHSNYVGR